MLLPNQNGETFLCVLSGGKQSNCVSLPGVTKLLVVGHHLASARNILNFKVNVCWMWSVMGKSPNWINLCCILRGSQATPSVVFKSLVFNSSVQYC